MAETYDPICSASKSADENETIEFEGEKLEEFKKIINDMTAHLSHLNDTVSHYGGKISRSDMDAYLGLFRYHFDDISKIAGMDAYLSNELSESTAMLRKANGEICRLRKELGDKISARATTSGIEKFEKLFGTWYGLSGFHYASVEHKARGIVAKFSPDTERELKQTYPGGERRYNYMIDAELAPKIENEIPYAVGRLDRRDRASAIGRGEILDTDKNRSEIKDIFASAFPGSHISKFESMRDGKDYCLRFEVYVSYEDLENWIAQLTQDIEKSQD